MKRMKNYFFLGILLFGISLTLINCEEEPIPLEEQHVHDDSPYSITRKDSDELQQNVLLSSNLEDLNLAIQKAQLRTKSGSNDPDVYDFTIDTTSANYIENQEGTYHSYTFAIKRDYDYGPLENLLLAYDETVGYKAYLVKYNFTYAEKEDYFNGGEIDLTNIAQTIELDISNLNIDFRLKQFTCVVAYRTVCMSCCSPITSGSHDECSGHYFMEQSYLVGCYYSSSGGGGGSGGTSDDGDSGDTGEGGDSSSGTGSSGGGSTSGDPDVTTPTECRDDCPPELSGDVIVPCETGDEILDNLEVQKGFDLIWEESNTRRNVPVEDRREKGGLVIIENGIFKFTPFPSEWRTDPCGIYGPEDWIDFIPDNAVAMVHVHPYYEGEDAPAECESAVNPYTSGPGDGDHQILDKLRKDHGILLYGITIDGDNIGKYLPDGTTDEEIYKRCGY